MKAEDFAALILSRLTAAGVDASAEAIEGSAAYLALLARWNQRINLTAFDLDRPANDAIDRLVVEPLSAARFVHPDDQSAIDVGSGGGSPALPFKLAAPWLRMQLIEARTRKSAFLREAVRALGLANAYVETARFDDRWFATTFKPVDVVTMRAVRADAELWQALGRALRPGGRLFWFVELVISPNTSVDLLPAVGWRIQPRFPGQASGLTILERMRD